MYGQFLIEVHWHNLQKFYHYLCLIFFSFLNSSHLLSKNRRVSSTMVSVLNYVILNKITTKREEKRENTRFACIYSCVRTRMKFLTELWHARYQQIPSTMWRMIEICAITKIPRIFGNCEHVCSILTRFYLLNV